MGSWPNRGPRTYVAVVACHIWGVGSTERCKPPKNKYVYVCVYIQKHVYTYQYAERMREMGWRSAVTTTSSPWSRRHETLKVVPCHETDGALGEEAWGQSESVSRSVSPSVSQSVGQSLSPWTDPAKTHAHTYVSTHLCDVDAGSLPRGLLPLHDEVVQVLPEGRAWEYADG